MQEHSREPADPDPYAAFLRVNYVRMHAAHRRATTEAEGGGSCKRPSLALARLASINGQIRGTGHLLRFRHSDRSRKNSPPKVSKSNFVRTC
jgi:hypothetical protein